MNLRESLLLEGIEGKTICVTGTFSVPRTKVWEAIENAGGIVHKGVKRNTDFLVAGAGVGYGKTSKAEQLGVTVISEREFWNMIKGRGRPSTKPLTPWRGNAKHGEFRGQYERERFLNKRDEREPSYLDLVGESIIRKIREQYLERDEEDIEQRAFDDGVDAAEMGKEEIVPNEYRDSALASTWSDGYKAGLRIRGINELYRRMIKRSI
jgi:hypothetical protein